jgi:predicted nucleotidyltransferase
MRDELLDVLKKKLQSEKAVKFAYLFGSQARRQTGGLSDIDALCANISETLSTE